MGTMAHVTVSVNGRTYEARDTGERWNGAPVLAFRADVMARLVAAGDGADANGEGLRYDVVNVLEDVSDGRADVVEVRAIDGASHYVPAGRVWEIVEDDESDDVEACPACGDPIDYCQGHGEIGDPAGRAILDAHDDDRHADCHPAGCDVAAVLRGRSVIR